MKLRRAVVVLGLFPAGSLNYDAGMISVKHAPAVVRILGAIFPDDSTLLAFSSELFSDLAHITQPHR
jgi:hypothetical protein